MADTGFKGQVAIVTGAAGGIGSAVARRLASEGVRVALVDRDAAALGRIASELGTALPLVADVTQESDVAQYVRKTVDELGQVDLLFNNAGIEGRMTNIVDSTVADFDSVLAVNVRGVFLALREVLRVMQRQGHGGAIVNTASIAGLRGGPGLAPYVASKHAVIGLTRSAAQEAAAFGVRVNAVAPGYIDTRMLASLHEARSPDDPAAARRAAERRVPLQRLGSPEEVANLVIWLLSAEASYITGSVHVVDAGVTT